MIFRHFDYKRLKELLVKVLDKNYNCYEYDYLYFELNKIFLVNRCKPRFHIKENYIKFIFKNKKINDFFIIKFDKKFSFQERFFISDFLLNIFVFN